MAADRRSGRSSWWSTLPGVLTAVAALTTAVTGLIVGLHQAGLLTSSSTAPPPPSIAAEGEGEGQAQDDQVAQQQDDAAAEPVAASVAPSPRAGPYEATLPLGQELRAGETSYELLDYETRPDSDGNMALSLAVRMTNHSPYPDNFWDRSFRLSVADDVIAPSGNLNEVVEGGATGRGTVLFVLPAAAGRAELRITVDEDLLTVPFELRRAG